MMMRLCGSGDNLCFQATGHYKERERTALIENLTSLNRDCFSEIYRYRLVRKVVIFHSNPESHLTDACVVSYFKTFSLE